MNNTCVYKWECLNTFWFDEKYGPFISETYWRVENMQLTPMGLLNTIRLKWVKKDFTAFYLHKASLHLHVIFWEVHQNTRNTNHETNDQLT